MGGAELGFVNGQCLVNFCQHFLLVTGEQTVNIPVIVYMITQYDTVFTIQIFHQQTKLM
jgi:hypothetical protein